LVGYHKICLIDRVTGRFTGRNLKLQCYGWVAGT
jgi:hypothetical protein